MPRIPQLPARSVLQEERLPFIPEQPLNLTPLINTGIQLTEFGNKLKDAEDSVTATRINEKFDLQLGTVIQELSKTPDPASHLELATKQLKLLETEALDSAKNLRPVALTGVQKHILTHSSVFLLKVQEQAMKMRVDALKGEFENALTLGLEKANAANNIDELAGIINNVNSQIDQASAVGVITKERAVKDRDTFKAKANEAFLTTQAFDKPSEFLRASEAGGLSGFIASERRKAVIQAREELDRARKIVKDYNNDLREITLNGFQKQALFGNLDFDGIVKALNADLIKPTDVQSTVNMNNGAKLASGQGSLEIQSVLLDFWGKPATPEAARLAKQRLLELGGRGLVGNLRTKDGKSNQLLDELEILERFAVGLETKEQLDALRDIDTAVANTLMTTRDPFRLKRLEQIRQAKERVLSVPKERAKEEADTIIKGWQNQSAAQSEAKRKALQQTLKREQK